MQITNKIISFISTKIPLSYYGIVCQEVGNAPLNILNVGCGNGIFMSVLNSKRKHQVTGVDIFPPYLRQAKKTGVYNRLITQDINKLTFPDKSFDIVICNHVIEHLKKNEGLKLLKCFEKIARKKIIVVTPVGFLEQDERDDNKHQRHLSSWFPHDFSKLGYKVIGQRLNIYYRNKLINKLSNRIGVFNNFFFLIHVIFQPFISRRYSLCYQLINIKEI